MQPIFAPDGMAYLVKIYSYDEQKKKNEKKENRVIWKKSNGRGCKKNEGKDAKAKAKLLEPVREEYGRVSAR